MSNCPNHRLVMISSEAVYKYKWSAQPEKEVYTYQCVGECKEKSTFTPKIKK